MVQCFYLKRWKIKNWDVLLGHFQVGFLKWIPIGLLFKMGFSKKIDSYLLLQTGGWRSICNEEWEGIKTNQISNIKKWSSRIEESWFLASVVWSFSRGPLLQTKNTANGFNTLPLCDNDCDIFCLRKKSFDVQWQGLGLVCDGKSVLGLCVM